MKMKKLALIAILTFAVSAAAFAQRPAGWGVGVIAQNTLQAWEGQGGDWGVGLSLKAPQLPVFWGLNLEIRDNFFGLGLLGDYYLLEQVIVDDINFGWFIGLGGYGSFGWGSVGGASWTTFRFGGRIPVGVYIMPVDFLEIFLNLAPSLGFQLHSGDFAGNSFRLGGGLGLDFGIRFWF